MVPEAQPIDVLIVGGGTVGLSLAIDILQSTELSVAVVEAYEMQSARSEHPSLDARCLALASASYEYLQTLFVSATNLNACAIKHIQVSDKGFLGKCYLHAEEFGSNQLGMVTPIQSLGSELFKRFQALLTTHSDRAFWYCPNTVVDALQNNQHVVATLSNELQLHAQLMVFADGGRTPIKQALGFETSSSNYQQTAVIANVVCDQPHQNWAFERFTKSGPLALLPLDSSAFEESSEHAVFSLVWTLDSDDTRYIDNLCSDDSFFLSELTNIAGIRHGRFIKTSERSHYPLRLAYTKQLTQHRCVVIGNAAQALHPIAGQGFNLGLRDVQTLMKSILQSTEQDDGNTGLGNWQFTHDYQTQREADREQVIGATDGLVHCFSNHHWPLVVGRNAGLLAMNKIEMVKQHLARRAMGY